MKFIRKLLTVLFMVLLAALMILPAAAEEEYDIVVYVDNINGNNSNDGLTEATAVKVEKYGEAILSAKVSIKLSDGTAYESSTCTMTMRSMLEALNRMSLTTQQLAAVRTMIEKFAIIKSWDTANLYA